MAYRVGQWLVLSESPRTDPQLWGIAVEVISARGLVYGVQTRDFHVFIVNEDQIKQEES